jgi:hypothetical protein
VLTRDLAAGRSAQRAQRYDVCEHLLRRPAPCQPAQERKQVLQIEAGQQQVDELAGRFLVEGALIAEAARQVPTERDVQRPLPAAAGERSLDVGAIGRAR